MKISEESLKEMQVTIKHAKIHAMVASERQGEMRGEEKYSKKQQLATTPIY